jgi:hypothetical protein
MRGASVVLALLVALTLGMGGAVAQGGESAAGQPLDLPALVLRPGDLPAGYGLLDGLFMSPLTGVVAEYWAELGLPDPTSDGTTLARKAITRLTQYTDADAAQERLNEIRDELSGTAPQGDEIVVAYENGQPIDAPRQIVPDAPIVADDTITTTLTSTSVQGTPVGALEITYRTGPVLAEVTISDFSGTPPTYDEVATLAYVVLDRISGAGEDAGPGWSGKALRLDDEDDDLKEIESAESYLELDGEALRLVNDTDEDFADRSEIWADGNVRDVYQVNQTLGPLGSDDSTDHLFSTIWIYGFGSAEDAKGFIATAIDDLLDDASGYVSVEEERVSGFGGVTGGIAYEVDLGNGDTSSGHRVWVQDGRTVVSVQVDTADGVTPDGVKELARAQMDCVKSDGPCEAVAVPEGMFE